MGHKTLLAGLILAFSFLFTIPVYAEYDIQAAVDEQAIQNRPWLGITIQEVNEEAARSMGLAEAQGVMVSDVVKGGPADMAGVQMGDVIVELNGEDVTGADDFISRVRSTDVGSTVALEVNRGGTTENINVQLAKMPGDAMGGMTGGGGMGGMMGDRQSGMGAMGQCPPCPMMGGKGMKGGHARGDGMMAPIFGHMYGKMMKAVKGLNLSADQRASAREIHMNFKKQAIRTGAEIKIAGIELHELLMSDPVNMDKVKGKIGEILSKKADLMMAGIKSVEDFKKLLTTEQKGKLKDMLSMDTGMDEEMGSAGEMASQEDMEME